MFNEEEEKQLLKNINSISYNLKRIADQLEKWNYQDKVTYGDKTYISNRLNIDS